MSRSFVNHAHKRYLPPDEPPRESLALTLLAGAGLVLAALAAMMLLVKW